MTYRGTNTSRGPSLDELVEALTAEPTDQKTVTFHSVKEAFGVDWLTATCTVEKLERGNVYGALKQHWRIEGRIVSIEGYPSTSGGDWPEYWQSFVRYRAKYSIERGEGIFEWVTREWITPKQPTGFSEEERAAI